MEPASSNATISYKCMALNNSWVESKFFEFCIDQNWRENSYFQFDGKSIKLKFGGSWTCVLGTKVIQSGVHHFSIKLKPGTIITAGHGVQILLGYVSQEDSKLQTPIRGAGSQNVFYVYNGGVFSKGPNPRHSGIKLQSNEIIHSICDMENGIFTFLRGSTGQTLGETFIPPQSKGKPMRPVILFINPSDSVEILS